MRRSTNSPYRQTARTRRRRRPLVFRCAPSFAWLSGARIALGFVVAAILSAVAVWLERPEPAVALLFLAVVTLVVLSNTPTRVTIDRDEVVVSWLDYEQRLPIDGLVADFPHRAAGAWKLSLRNDNDYTQVTAPSHTIQALERALLKHMRRGGIRWRERKASRAGWFG